MQHPQRTQSSLLGGWRGALVALFCLGMIALASAEMVATATFHGLPGEARAARTGISASADPQARGWAIIARVDAGSSADRARLRPGDRVRFDDSLLLSTTPPPGTVATVTVRHAGRTRVLCLPYETHAPGDQAAAPVRWVATIGAGAFCIALGALVLWRGWGRWPALALGLGLVGLAAGDTIPWWIVASPLRPAGLAAMVAREVCALGVPLVPVLLYHQTVAAVRRGWWLAVAGLGALAQMSCTGQTVAQWLVWAVPTPWHIGGDALPGIIVALACWWSWRGLRDATGARRSRFSILLLAGGVTLAGKLLSMIGHHGLALPGAAVQPWLDGGAIALGSVVCPLLMAYAVLRQRVIDLGFALNRTLVYALLGAILLGPFALIAWASAHILPAPWVNAGGWIDAGAAVALCLTFRRTRSAVGHGVDLLWFRRWHTRADALRRFVATAAHFEDARALARAFADELARFGGDARVALYRRNDGALDRVGGTWDGAPRHFREDDPAFALMRADRRPLDLGATHTGLPGVLALPMLDHGVLTGLVLMDLKGHGALYRPDEVALLGWAAHSVGLALARLNAALIETENRLLKAQLSRLNGLIADRLDRATA